MHARTHAYILMCSAYIRMCIAYIRMTQACVRVRAGVACLVVVIVVVGAEIETLGAGESKALVQGLSLRIYVYVLTTKQPPTHQHTAAHSIVILTILRISLI